MEKQGMNLPGMSIPGIKRSIEKTALGSEARQIVYTAALSATDGSLRHDEKSMSLTIDSFSARDWGEILDRPQTENLLMSRETFLGAGGWQSWSAGWELAMGEKLPKRVLLIPELIKLTNRPFDTPSSNETVGHFIHYFRNGSRYICAASHEGDGLAPLTFRVDRKTLRVGLEVYCPGKAWKEGECIAAVTVFAADGFFAFKEVLGNIYKQNGLLPNGKASMPGGYESWYNHYNRINEKIILDDLLALGSTNNLIKLRYLDRKIPAVFQIDDGWEKKVGEWEINAERFPGGLRPIADKIEAAGCIPGLWLAPFIVTKSCRVYREKPDWVLRESGGNPVVAGFNHLWDRQYYSLDISREDVLAYLKELMDRVIDDWGFRYIKLDFLYAGFFYGAFANPGPPHEHYRRACSVLTARTSTAKGLSVTYLGCGVPFGQSYRQFPLSRIGADTREIWDWNAARLIGHVGRPSAYISLMDTIGRAFMNGAVYINDPDVIFLRNTNCALTETEKETIALVNFLLASQIMFSDDPSELDEPAIALTKKIAALYERLEGDDYGAARIDRDVFALESYTGRYAGLINLRNKSYTLSRKRDAALFSAMRGARPVVDHRVFIGEDSLAVSPHSITIMERE